MEKELELLRLKLVNTQLQAQSLERDVIVLNYARLLQEAQAIQQQIAKIEEEVRQNADIKNPVDLEPIGPDPDSPDSIG
jgi:hypothetical protein